MRCEECGYRDYTTVWDWYWEAYLCDFCFEELELEEYYYYKTKSYYSYRYDEYDDYGAYAYS